MKAEDTVMSQVQRDNIFYRGIGTLEGVCKIQAEISFKARDKEIDTTIKAVLGQTSEHCNQHGRFVDECMACHDVCNENIDWELLDMLKDIKKAGQKEVVEEIIKDTNIPVRYKHNATCYDCMERMREKYIGKPNSKGGE